MAVSLGGALLLLPSCEMAQPPNPKRRRLTGPEEVGSADAVPPTLISRSPVEVKASLQTLYSSLETYGDVVICARAADGSQVEFIAVSALVAAASRPLGAMLFGPMRMCTPRSGEDRPQLHLQITEPVHFRHLLSYIHGQDLRARPPALLCTPATTAGARRHKDSRIRTASACVQRRPA